MRHPALVAAIAAASFPGTVYAQDFSLNAERLSSVEEPIATEVGDVTIAITGLVDGRLEVDLSGFDDLADSLDPGLIGNFQIDASTQLANRWNVGVAYFGQVDIIEGDTAYTDNLVGFVGGAWGTAIGGEVETIVREETRRLRGVGNAFLAFDDALGRADGVGGAYVGQFGPARLSSLVDEDGDFDFGFVWQRPIGASGYRYTARYTDADFTAADGLTEIDTRALTGTFEYLYGRSNYNAGLGYERLDAGAVEGDRWFATAGWQHQFGNVVASAEAHYGEIEGQAETSAALGLRYDLSRGLSLDLGVNHAKADVTLGDNQVLDTDDTRAIASVRFSF